MSVVDDKIVLWMNSLVGKSSVLDRIMIWLASDYFIPVVIALFLLGLWFFVSDATQRESYQRAIIVAAVSMGSACGFVLAFYHLNWHEHPFQDYQHPELLVATSKIFYPIHDPTFPSNTSAVTFAGAAALWQKSRKVGALLLIPAILMPLAKVYAAVYYPSDILGGAAVGIFTAYFVRWVMPVFEPIVSRVFAVLRKLCLV